jgi:hypothetical protein
MAADPSRAGALDMVQVCQSLGEITQYRVDQHNHPLYLGGENTGHGRYIHEWVGLPRIVKPDFPIAFKRPKPK